MAIAHNSAQITWSASNSVSVSSGGNQTSDELNISDTAFRVQVSCKADNAGTPASGDTVDFYLLQTTGDPDGASTSEYDTTGHALFLCQLDTNTEDPAIKTVEIPVPQEGIKIYAENNASSNSITVSVGVLEQTG